MTLTTKHVVRVITSIGITVVLTSLLWPLIQGQSVTALAVAGGVATSSLIEDRIGGHGLHWGGALASGAICGLICFVGLRLLMP
jgi:hypothetical protein